MTETVKIYYRDLSNMSDESKGKYAFKGYDPDRDLLVKVGEVPVPSDIDETEPKTEAEMDEAIGRRLVLAFRQMNHVDGNEWIADKSLRSMMVGDVAVVGEQAYSCEPASWVPTHLGLFLVPEGTPYTQTERQDHGC
jgi:hypothetical protein